MTAVDNTQLDESCSFRPQLCDKVNQTKISSESLQQGEYIVNLPGFAPAAAVLISELHGRMGHFPTVIRLKKVEGAHLQSMMWKRSWIYRL